MTDFSKEFETVLNDQFSKVPNLRFKMIQCDDFYDYRASNGFEDDNDLEVYN